MKSQSVTSGRRSRLPFLALGVVAGFACLCAYNFLIGMDVRFRPEFMQKDSRPLLIAVTKEVFVFLGGGIAAGYLLSLWSERKRARSYSDN